MNTYKIADVAGRWFVLKDTDKNPRAKHDYFAGYDFMGSVTWEHLFSFDYALSNRDEAEQIVRDLRAAE